MCDEIAKLGERNIGEMRGIKQGQTIISWMIDEAMKKAKQLLKEGRLDGIEMPTH